MYHAPTMDYGRGKRPVDLVALDKSVNNVSSHRNDLLLNQGQVKAIKYPLAPVQAMAWTLLLHVHADIDFTLVNPKVVSARPLKIFARSSVEKVGDATRALTRAGWQPHFFELIPPTEGMSLFFDLDKKMDSYTHGDAKRREAFQSCLWALVPSFLDLCVSWMSTHMDDTTPEDLDIIVKASKDLPGCVPSSKFSCHVVIKHRRRWLAFDAMRQVSKALQEVALKELPEIGKVIDMQVYTRWRCVLPCCALRQS